MEKIVFNDYETLADIMLDAADNGDITYAVCFFDDAVKLLKELMAFDKTSVGGIEIADTEYNGYSKEYYVSLDGDYIIDVQPALNDNGTYFSFESEKVYIVGDANSAIIKNIDDDKCYEIEFDLDCDKYCDLLDTVFDNTKIVRDYNGNPVGIGVDVFSLLSALCGE